MVKKKIISLHPLNGQGHTPWEARQGFYEILQTVIGLIGRRGEAWQLVLPGGSSNLGKVQGARHAGEKKPSVSHGKKSQKKTALDLERPKQALPLQPLRRGYPGGQKTRTKKFIEDIEKKDKQSIR